MKASRVAAEQAKSLANLSLLVMALCEKQGIDVDKVLGIEEPQTREEMKAYATKLPAPTPPAELPIEHAFPDTTPVAVKSPAKAPTKGKKKYGKSK